MTHRVRLTEGKRVVGKRGIWFVGANYLAAELAPFFTRPVFVRQKVADEIEVYTLDGTFICNAKRVEGAR
jgi:hypothetical protein